MAKKDREPILMATIDVGAHAARMLIAQVYRNYSFEVLEDLVQPVPLGANVFQRGKIGNRSIRLLCEIFQNFKQKMDEYGVELYKAIATSAVREASNSDIFLERIEHASGIKLEVFEGIDGARLDYLTVNKDLQSRFNFNKKKMLIADIGTGATQVSVYDKGQICFTETIRAGTLRILKEMPAQLSSSSITAALAPFVEKAFNELEHTSYDLRTDGVVAMGSSVRTAAIISGKIKKNQKALSITKEKFSEVYEIATSSSSEKLAETYNVNSEMAEAVAPCSLILSHLLNLTGAAEIIVPMTSTKDALLLDFINEVLDKHDYFSNQILAIARNIAGKYKCIDSYTENVMKYSEEIFKRTESLHGLDEKELLLLKLAAYFHTIGLFINNRAYHKHSYYLISNTDIPGLTDKQRKIVALTARYHRKAFPKPVHAEYTSLDRRSRSVVNKLASILRIACGIASSYEGYKNFYLKIKDESVEIKIKDEAGTSFDRDALEKSGGFFNYVFSKRIIFT
jgi:exopolyphosphatase/guanosine-5'-triphosphate,3'-diphosphate pyrophosphatase